MNDHVKCNGIFAARVNAILGTAFKPNHQALQKAWVTITRNDKAFFSKFLRGGPPGTTDNIVQHALHQHAPDLAFSTGGKGKGKNNNNELSSNKGKGKGKGKTSTKGSGKDNSFANLILPDDVDLFTDTNSNTVPVIKSEEIQSDRPGLALMPTGLLKKLLIDLNDTPPFQEHVAVMSPANNFENLMENKDLVKRYRPTLLSQVPLLRGRDAGPKRVDAILFQLGSQEVTYYDTTVRIALNT